MTSDRVLLDTSMWTRALRRVGGDPIVRARVDELVAAKAAVWCDPVRLELWAGVRGDAERKDLRRLDVTVARLPITDLVWTLACDIASDARARAFTFKSNDLLIFACAQTYGVRIEHVDKHYGMLEDLWPLR